MIAIESTDFNNLHPLPSQKATSAIDGYGAHSPMMARSLYGGAHHQGACDCPAFQFQKISIDR